MIFVQIVFKGPMFRIPCSGTVVHKYEVLICFIIPLFLNIIYDFFYEIGCLNHFKAIQSSFPHPFTDI